MNRRAKILVFQRTEALNGRKSREKRGPGVACLCKRRLRGSFRLILRPPVRPEVPGNVVVNVDPTRQHGQPAEIECGAFGLRLKTHDFSIGDNDPGVSQHMAAAIKNSAGLQNDCFFLRACDPRVPGAKRGESSENRQNSDPQYAKRGLHKESLRRNLLRTCGENITGSGAKSSPELLAEVPGDGMLRLFGR